LHKISEALSELKYSKRFSIQSEQHLLRTCFGGCVGEIALGAVWKCQLLPQNRKGHMFFECCFLKVRNIIAEGFTDLGTVLPPG